MSRTSSLGSLLAPAALVLVLLLAGTGIVLGDAEALVFAGIVAAGLVVLRLGRRRLAAVGLGLLSVNTAAWMVPGALSNAAHGEDVTATMLPATIAVVSLVTLAAAVGVLTRRGDARTTRGVLLSAVAVLMLFGAASMGGEDAETARAGLRLESKEMAFSTTRLAARAGEVTVRMRNGDLFWHTFTVPELGVNLRVPVRGERTATFTAAPGTYEFICAIPGHTQAGMRGTLRVR